jgi:hypothetical protein
MPKLKLCCLCLLIFLTPATGLQAALEFGLDFGQDGEIETSWRLKAGEEIQLDIYVSNVPEPGLQAMGFKFVYDAERLEVVEEESGVPCELALSGFGRFYHVQPFGRRAGDGRISFGVGSCRRRHPAWNRAPAQQKERQQHLDHQAMECRRWFRP